VSVGGTLTHFAAPPVLMVAGKWEWTTAFMLSMFGAKAMLAVLANSIGVSLLFRRELLARALDRSTDARPRVPPLFVLFNLVLLAAVVFSNHHPEAFMGLFLLFLGLSEAYRRHHDRLMLREGLMVAFFLAGLVVLGGQQRWWLQELLSRLDETTLFYGATLLTAITDNAALTYLGSLVEGVSDAYKYSLVAGAVAGGGLTVIANAPNPAGFAILKDHFEDQSISPFGLFAAALVPTLVVVACFRGIRGQVAEVFDWDLWVNWFSQLDRSFIFLLVLPFVVALVGLWAEFSQRRRSDGPGSSR
jgi:Na+/H+ antiporter NhaD/arsenite permease-like protein